MAEERFIDHFIKQLAPADIPEGNYSPNLEDPIAALEAAMKIVDALQSYYAALAGTSDAEPIVNLVAAGHRLGDAHWYLIDQGEF